MCLKLALESPFMSMSSIKSMSRVLGLTDLNIDEGLEQLYGGGNMQVRHSRLPNTA